MAIDIQSEKQPRRRRQPRARPQAERPYATVEEVRTYMGVCPQTIWNWIKKGQLRGERIGKSYKIPRIAFEELKAKFPKGEANG